MFLIVLVIVGLILWGMVAGIKSDVRAVKKVADTNANTSSDIVIAVICGIIFFSCAMYIMKYIDVL